jgi:hypothetical protein
MIDSPLLPLERLLLERSKVQSEQPFLQADLFTRYEACLSFLRANIYPSIDAGLAALSQEDGIFTLHGPDHFDEVVRYAGLLLNVQDDVTVNLSAYEIFALLVAIRIHDAGNMYGREHHERRAYQILASMGSAVFKDQFEIRNIAGIAGAHGGVTPDGSKDTISQLRERETYGVVELRPRLIAAVVRFADEICENRTRAAEVLLDTNSLPAHNEVFHKYASVIKSVVPEPKERRVRIAYDLFVEDVLRKWGKGKINSSVQKVYLLEEIFSRLEKMFREREYCRRFMREVCDIEHVNATIEIHETPTTEFWSPQESLVRRWAVRSELDGYPSGGISISRVLGVTGKSLARELRNRKRNK